MIVSNYLSVRPRMVFRALRHEGRVNGGLAQAVMMKMQLAQDYVFFSIFSWCPQEGTLRAVLVEFLRPGIWTIGFVTGAIYDKNNEERLLKVFVPTPPNPISGTMIVVRESQTRDPGWSIEEALKAVISGGVISPAEIKEVGEDKGNDTLNALPFNK